MLLLLHRLEHQIVDGLQPVLTEKKLSYEQWRLLAALSGAPGQTMTQLGHITALPSTSVTRHVDKLVERALVIRRIDPADKRRVVAALSARGTRMVDEICTAERALADPLLERILPSVSPETFFEALNTLANPA